jgi:hypothetical protein
MRIRHWVALGAFALTSWAGAAQAGSCADEIYQADLAINKRLDEIAANGKGAKETTFATAHHQPTPATVAGAEANAGDIPASGVADIRKFMVEARQADDAGDKAGCEKALAEAKTIVGLQ